MDEAKQWALNWWVTRRLDLHSQAPFLHPPIATALGTYEARSVAEQTTGHVMLCGGPKENFSDRMPSLPHVSSGDDRLLPIDVLYGRYFPEQLLVEIYIKRIQADAGRFGWQIRDLLTIVRIHEYAHAIVHIGLDGFPPHSADSTTPTFAEEQLNILDSQGATDWNAFRARRDTGFRQLSDRSHELLAQAITWGCVCRIATNRKCDQITETFLELEARQPADYRLSPLIKSRAPFTSWPVVLAGARELAEGCNGDVFTLNEECCFPVADGLEQLISWAAFPADEGVKIDDTLVPFTDDVKHRLDAVDLVSAREATDEFLKLLLLRKGPVELRMYKEPSHQRPHFHLEYKTEYSASYAIDSFERLVGYMPRKYEEEILAAARSVKDSLAATWVSLNGPARCIAR